LPYNGGWELAAGQTTNFGVPKDFSASRFWGRSNCAYVNGNFKCDNGDCGPWVQCAWYKFFFSDFIYYLKFLLLLCISITIKTNC
jgi:hypothetical protein